MTKLTWQIIQVDEVISGSPVFLEEALKRMESLMKKKQKLEKDLEYRFLNCEFSWITYTWWDTVDSPTLKD